MDFFLLLCFFFFCVFSSSFCGYSFFFCGFPSSSVEDTLQQPLPGRPAVTSSLHVCLLCCCFQDYSQNAHGKEIDLLRVTVKVPGKRPPKAVAPVGPSPAPPGSTPGVNGLSKEPTPALPPPDGTSSGTSAVPNSSHRHHRRPLVVTDVTSCFLPASALSVGEERPAGGERGLQRCPSSLSTKAQSVGR